MVLGAVTIWFSIWQLAILFNNNNKLFMFFKNGSESFADTLLLMVCIPMLNKKEWNNDTVTKMCFYSSSS